MALLLACALALGAGAVLAHVTRPPEGGPAVGVRSAPPSSTAAAPTPNEPTPQPERAEEAVEEPRTGTFAAELKQGLVITGATSHRMILFTFDDGPDHRNTPALLDSLDELGVRAVFFLTASRLAGSTPRQREHQAIAREIVRRGHLVGNHTVDHVQLPLLDLPGIEAQVGGAERLFEEVLGARTWLVRPPGGARSPRVDALLAERGYTQVLWNLGTVDFQVRTAEDVVRTFTRVLERRERENGERGGVVLLHDTHAWSVEAMPRIVSWLRQRNCELLDEGEELYDVVDDPRYFFAPRGSASPSAAAPPGSMDASTLATRQSRLREEAALRCARVAAR
ncbi:MAG: polysaccharide deacetylase family protein [Sandaracinaceae bacterium]|nr:polysaccharide deacetylase family protein [Sandaracinaceae bacterium]